MYIIRLDCVMSRAAASVMLRFGPSVVFVTLV